MLLNNDTELITPDLLERLLGFCMQPDVGIVGAKLYYPDGTLQHTGVILGLGGVAGHIHAREPGDIRGYADRAITSQDLYAVTAACALIKREVFDAVGGLDEELKVAYNDVDFCIRVKQSGFRIIYCADAKMKHYESKSRGIEDSPDKLKRYAAEFNYMRRTWKDILARDPYYNRNLNDIRSDCTLRSI